MWQKCEVLLLYFFMKIILFINSIVGIFAKICINSKNKKKGFIVSLCKLLFKLNSMALQFKKKRWQCPTLYSSTWAYSCCAVYVQTKWSAYARSSNFNFQISLILILSIQNWCKAKISYVRFFYPLFFLLNDSTIA